MYSRIGDLEIDQTEERRIWPKPLGRALLQSDGVQYEKTPVHVANY